MVADLQNGQGLEVLKEEHVDHLCLHKLVFKSLSGQFQPAFEFGACVQELALKRTPVDYNHCHYNLKKMLTLRPLQIGGHLNIIFTTN